MGLPEGLPKIRPVGRWVLLQLEPREEKSPGGIFMPEGNLMERTGHVVAQVLAVGQGILDKKTGRYRPLGFEPGDRVYFRGYIGELHQPYEWHLHKDICLVDGGDIIGVVED